MLSIQSLDKSFQAPVLKGFSYEFPERGLFRLHGKSGSGKTTLLRMIAGLETPDAGQIVWERPPRLSVVFQEARLVPHLTLLENVLLVAAKKDVPRAVALLQRLGLGEDLDKKPSELSGGMKLRGAIARSLYFGGDVYLWDEPTRELDEKNKETVFSIMEELAGNALVICVTHESAWRAGTVIDLS